MTKYTYQYCAVTSTLAQTDGVFCTSQAIATHEDYLRARQIIRDNHHIRGTFIVQGLSLIATTHVKEYIDDPEI